MDIRFAKEPTQLKRPQRLRADAEACKGLFGDAAGDGGGARKLSLE